MTSRPLWQAEAVVRAVRGWCLHEQSWVATGVSIDSNTTKPGDLFIALSDSSYDGHNHVAAAFAAGASAALVARQPQQVPSDASLLFVEDTFVALQELGRAGRNRARGKIIAITGSFGKTSTKEILRLALSAVGKTYADQGLANTRWGVPLALACLPRKADYGIFEMGLTREGDLAALSMLARPDIAVVTTIEPRPLESFSSIEAIVDAQTEIFQGMNENGTVILNRDNEYYVRFASEAKIQGIKKNLSFSKKGKADASLIDVTVTGEESILNALISGRNVHTSIGSTDRLDVQNSLAALLAAAEASGKINECAAALPRYKPSKEKGLSQLIALLDGDTSFETEPQKIAS